MMRFIWFLVLLLPLASADIIAPTIYEQKDLGPTAFEEFTYSISVDCTAGTVRVIVMDESLKPVKGADSFLKYIDFAQPLISSVESDKDGFVLHKLPGDVKLMRGFFVLVIQKNEYRSKEIHFDIGRCYSDYVPPSPPQQEEPAPQPNETSPPPPVPEPEIPEPPVNETVNKSVGDVNVTEIKGEKAPPDICAGILALLMVFKFIRR